MSDLRPSPRSVTEPEDPCPCDSGIAYRRCCLPREEAEEAVRRIARGALEKAYRWLERHAAHRVEQAVEEVFLGGLTSFERGLLEELPAEDGSQVEANAAEWVLAEGWVELEERIVLFRDLVLGRGGPRFEPAEREWLRALVHAPLELWIALEPVPGAGLWVRRAGSEQEEPTWVADGPAAERLVAGQGFAARLVNGIPARLGCLYPLSGNALAEARRDLLEVADSAAEEGAWSLEETVEDPTLVRSEIVVTAWLRDRLDALVSSLDDEGGLGASDLGSTADGEGPRDAAEAESWYRQLYADFFDSRLPELDGLTPREAVRTERGRYRVRSILEEQERSERQQAREQGREPADLDFAWRELGLDRGDA